MSQSAFHIDSDVTPFLVQSRERLFAAQRFPCTASSAGVAPVAPGNYAVFDGSATCIYVGETKNLNQRLKQLIRGKHIFRRRYRAAKALSDSDARAHMAASLSFAYATTSIGRAEIEEYIITIDKPQFNY